MWIADASRLREIDRLAQSEFGIPLLALMESAGAAVFRSICELSGGPVVVVCGPGNNGGDGLVAARLLARAGRSVRAIMVAEPEKLGPLCTEQVRLLRESGLEPEFAVRWDSNQWDFAFSGAAVIVDALFGTGLSRPLSSDLACLIQEMNRAHAKRLAVDIPSGLDSDTGAEWGVSVMADFTVTFGLPKKGFFQGFGPDRIGDWRVEDIGIPGALLDEPTDAFLMDHTQVAGLFPTRLRSGHKGSSGSVLVVAGSDRMPGAAVLAVQAALRSGAGLVRIASTPAACQAVSFHYPEALLMPLATEYGLVSPSASNEIAEQQEWCDAAVFGPGLDSTPQIHQLLANVWREWRRPCVIDASALSIVAAGVPSPNAPAVLTPHPGEAARLLGCEIAQIQADRFSSAKALAEKNRAAIILKGVFSLVAGNEGPIAVNPTGNPGMATGGMGDTLGGVVGTLLAQGLTPQDAAMLGCYWHGLAGDLAAESIGEIGYTATEVALKLPAARAKILRHIESQP